MQDMPAIEMRIRGFGEELKGLLKLHHDKIQQHVEVGVARALAPLTARLGASQKPAAPWPVEESRDGGNVAE